MRRRGRPVMGAICGLLFGFFVALDLMIFGVRPLDSLGTIVLPIAGLVLGIFVGLAAPFGRSSSAPPAP